MIAAFDLLWTYDEPGADLVMAGPPPDPHHLAALTRLRDETKLVAPR